MGVLRGVRRHFSTSTGSAACLFPLHTLVVVVCSFTCAEVAVLHLTAGLLLERDYRVPGAVVLTDSKAAHLRLHASAKPSRSSGYVQEYFANKLRTVASRGSNIRLHWLPAHSGVRGKKAADAFGMGGHQAGIPVSQDGIAFYVARTVVARDIEAMHSDQRVVRGQVPQALPARISRVAHSVLREWLNCCDATSARTQGVARLCLLP